MPKVTIFNFYDYLKNPMAIYCVNQYKDKQILTLDDVKPYIDKCSHSKHCIERGDSKSYIGDQVRLLMGSEIDDFCYVDADCIINDLDKIKKDTIAVDCSSDGTFRLQNGTFFYGLKDFNKYYYDVYEKNWNLSGFVNWDVMAAVQLLHPEYFDLNKTVISPDEDTFNTGMLLGKGPERKASLPKIKNMADYIAHVYERYLAAKIF